VYKLTLIAIGGAGGAVARYVLAGWGQRLTETAFPLGTLLVNLVGCLLIGIGAAIFAGPAIVREEVRLGLLVGFVGGFTTFSTFGYESFALLSEREWWLATLNLLGSNVLGVLAVFMGYRVTVGLQGV
jgi:CrcB protein